MDEPSPDTSQHILANAPMAVIITDDDGLVLWCNKTLATWLDCPQGHCIGRTELALLGKNIAVSQDNSTPANNGPFTLGYTPSGIQRRVVRYPLPPNDGQYTVCYLDVSEEEALRNDRNQLAQQLAQHNTVDTLSGLLNEHAINRGLEPLISRSRRYQNSLSVVTMNIINLDGIIQSTGQVAADKVIVAVSQMLRDQIRWADMVGHLSAGQFIFILPETNKVAAVALANKLVEQLKNFTIMVDEQAGIQVVACFGITAWTKGDDARLLMSRSSDAAQAARQSGAFTIEIA
ncbi:MAG TPA: sensor domain-containing diguanylate cyclase [Gammaproteobacteria bacterium]|nr:sensor domain-containing diguanylate cyclase [Gammaproteobacteria bacterium]